MKIKIFLSSLFLFVLIITSCKKESSPAIVGKWMNTAVYTDPANGGYGWETVSRHEFLTLNPDSQFDFFTDVPCGAGIYSYNGSLRELLLQFEADQYGNSARSEIRKVETMTEDKLIISFVSPIDGMIYKTEYSRVN